MFNLGNEYVIGRTPKDNLARLWKLDLDDPQLLVPEENSAEFELNANNDITPVGDFLLEWGPIDGGSDLVYALHKFDPTKKNPLGKKPVQKGVWKTRWKFFFGHLDFGHYGNKHKDGPNDRFMQFVSLGNFVMAWVPEPARGNFHLWNFDPGSSDPLQKGKHPDGAWGTIQQGHKLLGMGNTILSWEPANGKYRLWSFDPKERKPMEEPVLQKGKWADIDDTHQMVALGEYILDWVPQTRQFRLWKFDSRSKNPLGKNPVRTGILPKLVNENMVLTGLHPNRPICEKMAQEPGTIDYMRSKIRHVVYYMVENRSFDHVCGWLYNKDDLPAQIIGPKGPYQGARLDDFNMDAHGKKIPLTVYEDGKLSDSFNLELLPSDPHHDHSDVMRQMFSPNEKGYKKRKKPNMAGFVMNNDLHQVMETYSAHQLPVLNGLAKNYAICDEWFCSIPGGTDVNRAFSLSGSSYAMLDNFQNGAEYHNWPNNRHRPSIWKTLWSNGISDWKIYNSIQWYSYVFSYHLFLEGQITSIDKQIAKADKANKPNKYLANIDQFFADAKNGSLPAFSYIEPVWVAPTGTTSYHPGHDLIPGEECLNKIFEALQEGPNWEETLLIITFDEHGGIYDHVPPPYALNPWPNDHSNGFNFDIMGVRVPTILVSPMISEKTVFRTRSDTAYDSTSILATLLHWFGVPKSQWGLGERTHAAPTFENVINRESPRTDKLNFTPPHDKTHPVAGKDIPVHDLHRTTAHRVIVSMGKDKMPANKLFKQADAITTKAKTLHELATGVDKFATKIGKNPTG